MSKTPMEKVKAFHAIKKYLSPEQESKIINWLELNDADHTIRVEGKNAEYEFIFLLLSLGHVKDLFAYEEGFSKLTDTETTDFQIITIDNRKLSIEVKSTSKDTLKIPQNLLSKKIDFAKKLESELYFAVRIKNRWIFISGEELKRKNRKINYEDHLNYDYRLPGDKFLYFPDSLTFKHTFNQSLDKTFKNSGFENDLYGYLERFSVESNNRKLYKITKNNNSDWFIPIILEGINKAATINDSHKRELHKLDKNRTLIITKMRKESLFKASEIIKDILINRIDLEDNTFEDATLHLSKRMDSFEKNQLGLEHILNILAMLNANGLQIYEFIDNHHMESFNQLYKSAVPSKYIK